MRNNYKLATHLEKLTKLPLILQTLLSVQKPPSSKDHLFRNQFFKKLFRQIAGEVLILYGTELFIIINLSLFTSF